MRAADRDHFTRFTSSHPVRIVGRKLFARRARIDYDWPRTRASVRECRGRGRQSCRGACRRAQVRFGGAGNCGVLTLYTLGRCERPADRVSGHRFARAHEGGSQDGCRPTDREVRDDLTVVGRSALAWRACLRPRGGAVECLFQRSSAEPVAGSPRASRLLAGSLADCSSYVAPFRRDGGRAPGSATARPRRTTRSQTPVPSVDHHLAPAREPRHALHVGSFATPSACASTPVRRSAFSPTHAGWRLDAR